MYEYANQLVSRGHDVTVVHPCKWNKSMSRALKLGPNPLRHPYLWLTTKTRRGDRPHNTVSVAEVSWYAVDKRVKMLSIPEPTASYLPDADILFGYDKELPPAKGKQIILLQGYGVFPRAFENSVFRAPVPKIVVSRWLFEQGVRLGVPAHEMFYIPNGIDHATYRVVTSVEKRSRRLAMMYAPGPIKGAKDGIQALDLVRARLSDFQAVLFGAYLRPKGLQGWIEYRYDPPQEELVSSIYNGSSIFICPSLTEGFGFPNVEAMACGCAVVSTDIGGIRDYAEHEVTALLSPPKNPEALAKNIIRLLENDDLRIRIANAGHERIKQFTWERSTDLLEQFLSEKIIKLM